MKATYVGILMGVFALSFMLYGVLNSNTPSVPQIYKYKTDLDPHFGKVRQLSSAGGQVVTDIRYEDVMDGGLGSDIFIVGKKSHNKKILVAPDKFVTKDILEIGFPSTQAGFRILGISKIDNQKHFELALHYFAKGKTSNGMEVFKVFNDTATIQAEAIDEFIFEDGVVVYYKDIIALDLPDDSDTVDSPINLYSPVFETGDWIKSWF